MMIYKNSDRKKIVSILLFRTVFDMLAAVVFLFSNGWNDCKAVLMAHRHFHQTKKTLLIRGPKETPASVAKLIYPKSILFGYFIFKKKKFSDLEHYLK